jgi:CheY-like chemotaxis protein
LASAIAKVLVVDDHPLVLAFVEQALTDAGHDVVATLTGTDALHAIHEHRFDVAIIDVNIPVPDGWEVLLRIRESAPGTRVLMTSGGAAEREAQERGAVGFLAKPYRLSELLLQVRQAAEETREFFAA